MFVKYNLLTVFRAFLKSFSLDIALSAPKSQVSGVFAVQVTKTFQSFVFILFLDILKQFDNPNYLLELTDFLLFLVQEGLVFRLHFDVFLKVSEFVFFKLINLNSNDESAATAIRIKLFEFIDALVIGIKRFASQFSLLEKEGISIFLEKIFLTLIGNHLNLGNKSAAKLLNKTATNNVAVKGIIGVLTLIYDSLSAYHMINTNLNKLSLNMTKIVMDFVFLIDQKNPILNEKILMIISELAHQNEEELEAESVSVWPLKVLLNQLIIIDPLNLLNLCAHHRFKNPMKSFFFQNRNIVLKSSQMKMLLQTCIRSRLTSPAIAVYKQKKNAPDAFDSLSLTSRFELAFKLCLTHLAAQEEFSESEVMFLLFSLSDWLHFDKSINEIYLILDLVFRSAGYSNIIYAELNKWFDSLVKSGESRAIKLQKIDSLLIRKVLHNLKECGFTNEGVDLYIRLYTFMVRPLSNFLRAGDIKSIRFPGDEKMAQKQSIKTVRSKSLGFKIDPKQTIENWSFLDLAYFERLCLSEVKKKQSIKALKLAGHLLIKLVNLYSVYLNPISQKFQLPYLIINNTLDFLGTNPQFDALFIRSCFIQPQIVTFVLNSNKAEKLLEFFFGAVNSSPDSEIRKFRDKDVKAQAEVQLYMFEAQLLFLDALYQTKHRFLTHALTINFLCILPDLFQNLLAQKCQVEFSTQSSATAMIFTKLEWLDVKLSDYKTPAELNLKSATGILIRRNKAD